VGGWGELSGGSSVPTRAGVWGASVRGEGAGSAERDEAVGEEADGFLTLRRRDAEGGVDAASGCGEGGLAFVGGATGKPLDEGRKQEEPVDGPVGLEGAMYALSHHPLLIALGVADEVAFEEQRSKKPVARVEAQAEQGLGDRFAFALCGDIAHNGSS
jgi:hypothetical protein